MFCVVLQKLRAKMSHQISTINIQDRFCMRIGLSFWNRAIPKMSWIKGVPGQVGPCQENDIAQVFNIFTPKFSTKIVWHISGTTFARGLARGHGKSCHTKAFPGRVTLSEQYTERVFRIFTQKISHKISAINIWDIFSMGTLIKVVPYQRRHGTNLTLLGQCYRVFFFEI